MPWTETLIKVVEIKSELIHVRKNLNLASRNAAKMFRYNNTTIITIDA